MDEELNTLNFLEESLTNDVTICSNTDLFSYYNVDSGHGETLIDLNPSQRANLDTLISDDPPEPPTKKRYKSKNSEQNRRNRINERLQQLKDLLPTKGYAGRSITKEEILSEAISYISELKQQVGSKRKRETSRANELMDGTFGVKPHLRAINPQTETSRGSQLWM